MESLQNLFKYFNRRKFLIEKCELNPDSGVNHRLLGTGTNAKDKRTGLTDDDKAKIKAGLEAMRDDLTDVINTL